MLKKKENTMEYPIDKLILLLSKGSSLTVSTCDIIPEELEQLLTVARESGSSLKVIANMSPTNFEVAELVSEYACPNISLNIAATDRA